MSVSDNAKIALLTLWVIGLIAWTFFGYFVMIAAFVELTGILKVLMGLYIVGSLLFGVFTVAFKAAVKRK